MTAQVLPTMKPICPWQLGLASFEPKKLQPGSQAQPRAEVRGGHVTQAWMPWRQDPGGLSTKREWVSETGRNVGLFRNASFPINLPI